jgi:hypothetical protein
VSRDARRKVHGDGGCFAQVRVIAAVLPVGVPCELYEFWNCDKREYGSLFSSEVDIYPFLGVLFLTLISHFQSSKLALLKSRGGYRKRKVIDHLKLRCTLPDGK